jgi:microsomal dipeptidase-like Zn-dependent dipeptidase
VLFGLGLRQIGIAYSDANALGSGLSEKVDAGLTNFGRRAVRRMNQVGLAIDISHSSDRTGIDVCEASEQPVFMTHAGGAAIWDTSRMKSDDVLRAVAETGGVIGMSAAPHTTLSHEHPRHSLEISDDPVDAGAERGDVFGVDAREHRDAQLVAPELAVGIGVDDAVGAQDLGDLVGVDVLVDEVNRAHHVAAILDGFFTKGVAKSDASAQV